MHARDVARVALRNGRFARRIFAGLRRAVRGATPCLVPALVLVAMAGSPVHAGEIVVESRRHEGVVEIRASADLTADRDTAWRVLTDYSRYVDFIPGLHASRIVSRQGSTVVVEQAGDAVLGPLRIPLEVTFEIRESPPGHVESRAIAGSLRSLESRYLLQAGIAGSRLDYLGHVRTGFPLFGRFEQSAVEANVARQFRALVEEIERQGAGPADALPRRR